MREAFIKRFTQRVDGRIRSRSETLVSGCEEEEEEEAHYYSRVGRHRHGRGGGQCCDDNTRRLLVGRTDRRSD